jgi:hypothetical protein
VAASCVILGVLVSLVASGAPAAPHRSQEIPEPLEARTLERVPGTVPEASAYVRVDEREIAGRYFNGADRPTLRDVTVTGLELVFDPRDPSHVLNEYADVENLAQLRLEAAVVRIRAPLRLPGTHVSIHAKRLIFEDVDPERPGQIATTPLPPPDDRKPGETFAPTCGLSPKFDKPPKPGEDGAEGQAAGSLTLVVEDVMLGEQEEVWDRILAGEEPTYNFGPEQREGTAPRLAWSDVLRLIERGRVEQLRRYYLLPPLQRSPRLVLRGGQGQAAGQGADGLPGCSVEPYFERRPIDDNRMAVLWAQPYMRKALLARWGGKPDTIIHVGGHRNTQGFPGSGGDAAPGGQPGRGGAGASIRTTLPVFLVEAVADLGGGEPGRGAEARRGGAPGTPTWSRSIRMDGTNMNVTRTEPGRDAPATGGKPGPDGAVARIAGHPPWLTPGLLRVEIERLRDTYLAGDTEAAARRVAEYLRRLEAPPIPVERDPSCPYPCREEPPPPERPRMGPALLDDPDLAPLHLEFIALAGQLADGLDYFGNPPGWAPMLPLEVIYQTYASQVEEALRLYALSHALERHWAATEERHALLDDAVASTRAAILARRRDLARARAALPALRAELTWIEKESRRRLAELDRREAQLLAEFQSEQIGRRILEALNNAVAMSSFALIGGGGSVRAFAGLTAVAAGGSLAQGLTQPGAAHLGSTGDALRNALLQPEREEARRRYAELDLLEAESAEAYAEDLRELSRVFSDEAGDALQAEIRAGIGDQARLEFEWKKQSSPAFQALVDEVVEFATRKQLFAQAVREALAAIDAAAADVAAMRRDVDTLARARSETRISRDARETVGRMNRRARDRLTRVKYYLVRAYEYRMLKPYPLDFGSQRVFDALTDALASSDEPLGRAAVLERLEPIFRADLEDLKQSLVEEFARHRVPALRVEKVLALQAAELEALNREGQVTVDLGRRLLSSRDRNARLQAIEVLGDENTAIRGGEVEVTVEAASWSELRWGDGAYLFKYGLERETSYLIGGFSWSALGGLRPMARSGGADHLLVELVGTPAAAEARFQPGARTLLKIRKDTRVDPPARIERLAFLVTIEKHRDAGAALAGR